MRASRRRSHQCVPVAERNEPREGLGTLRGFPFRRPFSAQHGALQLDARERRLEIGRGQMKLIREPLGRRRTCVRQVRAHDLAERAFAVGPARRAPRGRLDDVGDEASRGPHGGSERAALGRDPVRARAELEARRAPRADERLEEGVPPTRLAHGRGQRADLEQEIVQLVGVARLGLRLGDDLGDGRRIEAADSFGDLGGQAAAHRDGARAPLFERGVVEERVRVRVEDLVREHRRLGQVTRQRLDLARAQRRDDDAQPCGVHGLGEAVADRLAHERVVGDLDGAAAVVVLAGRLRGEHGRHEILRAHALDLRRHALAALRAHERERAHGVPAPARLEHGRLDRGLREQLLEIVGAQHLEHHLEREAVLRAQRQHDAVVGRGRLQLEVERAAKSFAQRHAPRAVDAPAEGRVNHELHAAALVEEPLGDDARLRGHGPERGAPREDVVAHELGAAAIERRSVHERGDRILAARRGHGDLLAQRRHLGRQLARARRALAEPERDRRRCAARALDAHLAHLDAADAPRRVAEQEDVARHRLDGEVLVERADERALGLEHDVVAREVGDGAARRDGGEARAAPAAQAAVDGVAVEQRARAAAARRDAVGQHVDDRIEVGARQVRVRSGLREPRVERVLVPLVGRARRDDLLREDVERGVAQADAVDLGAPRGAHEGGALDELVAREREEAALGRRADRVARAPDALQARRDRARRPDEAHEIDRAHVDAELERRRRDDELEVARLEARLGLVSPVARHAAVVRRDLLDAEALAEVQRHALDEPPRVDEHERRPVRAREVGDAIVDLAPLLVRAHGAELVVEHLDLQVRVAPLPDVDDRGRGPRAAQQSRRDLHGPHRRRKTDALDLRRAVAFGVNQRLEALERKREVRAALVGRHGVDLVDDDGAHVAQRAPPRVRRQQDVQRLGRRHEHVRRVPDGVAALGLRRVARAHGRADRGRRIPELGRERAQLGERLLEVALDVVRQRLERRHVDDRRPLGQLAPVRDRLDHELIERAQERRERLARPRGRRDEHVAALGDERPRLRLRGRGRAEAPREPRLHEGVKHPFSICHATIVPCYKLARAAPEGVQTRVDRAGGPLRRRAGDRRGRVVGQLSGKLWQPREGRRRRAARARAVSRLHPQFLDGRGDVLTLTGVTKVSERNAKSV